MRHKLLKPSDLVNLHKGQTGWYRISNAKTKDAPAEIFIYGHIGWDVTAGEFLKELAAVEADKIDVHIATNGGDVFDGIAILNALRAHQAEITTIVDAQALSAGSFIMQAGKTRKMMPNSTVMIHDALTGGAWAEGNAKDMREFAEEVLRFADILDQTSDNIAAIYAERAGGTAEQWRETMRAEKWYTAQAAVDAGLADEVVDLSSNIAPSNTPKVADPPKADDPWTNLSTMLEEAFK